MEEIDKKLIIENPSNGDVASVEAILEEITNREKELIKSWNKLLLFLTDEKEIEVLVHSETETKLRVSRKCTQVKQFLGFSKPKPKLEASVSPEYEHTTRSETRGVKLEKMKPPKFSGNIRNYARFKTDFETIVMPSYDEQIHLVEGDVYAVRPMSL